MKAILMKIKLFIFSVFKQFITVLILFSIKLYIDMLYKNFIYFLQVEIDSKNTITAMREGQVMMTCEKINPRSDTHLGAKYYSNMSAPVVYKRFFHVIPFKQNQKFKLVDLI